MDFWGGIPGTSDLDLGQKVRTSGNFGDLGQKVGTLDFWGGILGTSDLTRTKSWNFGFLGGYSGNFGFGLRTKSWNFVGNFGFGFWGGGYSGKVMKKKTYFTEKLT